LQKGNIKKVELKKIKYDCLKTILEMYKKADAGHIGSSLSCLDILIYLYFIRMRTQDKFILSKGHAAAAFYAILAKSGRLPESELETFYKEGTSLAAHPPCNKKIKEIPFGTGSLGHGLSIATGIALAAQRNRKDSNVYCLISEGDCNEGSTWEAALFAAQHHLKDLIVIIDHNKVQAFGKMEEVINLDPLKEKWLAFNFDVVEAKNGNDFESLKKAFAKMDSLRSDKPKCIIAHTTKGSGISYMEGKMEWHYLAMSDEQYQMALEELEQWNA